MNAALRVFFVDDEAMFLGILSSLLHDDFEVETFSSAKSCLARLKDNKPDILLLDVSMPEMDGIQLCKAIKEDFDTQDIPVIFMSSKDDMETRMMCYEAGGEDFVAKPLEALDLQQKLRIASRVLTEKKNLSEQAGFATRTAMSAMTSMGELGVVLQFLAKSFSCVSVEELAEAILSSLSQYELIGAIQFRCSTGEITISIDGQNVPLEVSVLNHMRTSGRIFQFKSRCVFNFGALTLLLKNMPLEDPERCGRIRDNVALLAEGAEARLKALELEQEARERRGDIEATLAEVKVALDAVHANYRRNCFEVTQAMHEYQDDLAQSYVHLGLSETQENELSLNANKYMQRMVGKQDESLFIVGQLEKIAQKLERSLDK